MILNSQRFLSKMKKVTRWENDYVIAQYTIRYLYEGTMVSAEEALSIGLVDIIYPPERLFKEVQNYAESLAQKPAKALAAIHAPALSASHAPLRSRLRLPFAS